MRRHLCCAALLLICGVAAPSASRAQAADAARSAQASRQDTAPTTIVVVRHAEKALDDPRDPTLTPEGQARARALLDVVEDAGVTAIYSTQFRRTRSTVEPLAERLGVPVRVREIASGQADAYAEALAREVLREHAGRSVVVVGHSNTVPQIVRAFSGRPVAAMTEEEYDHAFVIVVPRQGAARLFRVRYGTAGPR